MPTNWSALRNNLHEIYEISLPANNLHHHLVANITGTRLYSSANFNGKIWKWFYSVFNLVFGSSFQNNRFQSAMQHTHKQFAHHLDFVAKNAAEYYDFVQGYLNGKPHTSKDGPSRKVIRQWYESTSPLIKLVNKSKISALNDFIHIGFMGDSLNKSRSAPFSCGEYSETIKRLRRVIDLEGYLQEPLAWPLMLKAAASQNFDPDEEKRFKALAGKIEKHASKIGVRKMHKIFEAIIKVISTIQKNDAKYPLSVTNLELALVDHGVSVFSKSDPKQLAWRDSLAFGEHLICKQYELIVGNRLGIKPDGQDDKNYIYEIQNVPNVVLSVGTNTSIHHLKQKIGTDHGWGIKSAKYIEIDPKGRFAVLERLKDPIDSYQWKSAKAQLNPEDEDVGTPLWRLLQWLLEQQKTPHHFSSEYLMFDAKGRLKCLKVALEGEFNFDALVAFAYKCSKGHPKVFQFLMEGSGLCQHTYAKFYEQIVDDVSKGKTNDLLDLSSAMGINDKKIVETGSKLRNEALALKQKCFEKLKAKYINQAELETQVGVALAFCYKESSSAGIIPAYLEEDMIKETQIAMD